MAKKVIKLTENDLHRIIKESVSNILSEISHGYVQNAFDRTNDGKANINKNKTPEQIQAQKNRITKSFNQNYGSNEQGNQINYDFEPNDLNYVQNGEINRQNPYSNHFFRNQTRHKGNGGVTINGERYTPSEVNTIGLNASEAGGVSDNKFDWYGSVEKHGHGVMDSNKKPVNTNKFNNQQIDALNNVNNTYKKTTNMFNKPMTLRGGKPFKYNEQ